MAVPSSGTLTMLGIAQERKYGTYGSGTISYAILMTDLINGGGSNSFPALNTLSPSKPNTSTPHAMNEWYGYDQDYEQWRSFDMFGGEGFEDAYTACVNGEGDNQTFYYDDGATGTGVACPPTGVTIYEDSDLTAVFDGQNMWWHSNACGRTYHITDTGDLDELAGC